MFTVIEMLYSRGLLFHESPVGCYQDELTAEDAAYRFALAYKPEFPEHNSVYWVFNTKIEKLISDFDSRSCKAVHKAIHG